MQNKGNKYSIRMSNFFILQDDEDDIDDEDCSGGFDGGFDETHIAQSSHNNMTQQSLFSEHDGTILTQDKLVAAPHKVIQQFNVT